MSNRATKADRALAMYVRELPVGKHVIDVVPEKGQAILKPEGGLILEHDGKRITIARSGLVRVTVKPQPFHEDEAQ